MGGIKFQNNIGTNGWYYSLPKEDIAIKTPTGSLSFDYVVVGAGFVGIAATKRLAELAPEASIALIDATRIGLGTAGRCSGFIIDTPHKGDLLHNDPILHKQAIEINRKGIEWMGAQVKQKNIDCSWQRAGKFQAAASKRGELFLEDYKKMLQNAEEEHKVLEPEELQEVLGTEHYQKAIFTPDCVLIQPGAYLMGMAKKLPKNVEVYENTRVTEVKSGASRVTIQTKDAVISCKKLVLSVNIYAKEFGYFKNKIIPIVTYASMTNPLTAEQEKVFRGTYGWGLTSADKGGTTLRMTLDKRLVIRNHYSHTPNYEVNDNFIKRIGRQHQLGLTKRYPHLEDLNIEYSWGGVCAVSRNFGFFAGELDKNIYSSLGHNGVGGARGSLAGKAIADKVVLGRSEDLEILGTNKLPCWNPPEPFLSVGVSTRLAWERFKSRTEL